MQAGFAMVEAGFTRAKNAGNIIMKNLMDFCLGTVAFLIIGYSLLMGHDFAGLIGWGESPSLSNLPILGPNIHAPIKAVKPQT